MNKIKQFFKNTWNWTKKKWKKITAIIIGTAGIGALVVIDQPAPIIEPRTYIVAERNFENIQYAELRKQIDYLYNNAHDALSIAYYEKTPFVWKGKDYGLLDKATFEKLQFLLWDKYLLLFHQENLKQSVGKIIPEREYNDIFDEQRRVIGKKTLEATERINQLKSQGLEIEL